MVLGKQEGDKMMVNRAQFNWLALNVKSTPQPCNANLIQLRRKVLDVQEESKIIREQALWIEEIEVVLVLVAFGACPRCGRLETRAREALISYHGQPIQD